MLIPHIPTLIPRIPRIPSIITPILLNPTLIPRVPTLVPRVPIIPLIPFPDPYSVFYRYPYTLFKSTSFISNARLQLTKKQANATP